MHIKIILRKMEFQLKSMKKKIQTLNQRKKSSNNYNGTNSLQNARKKKTDNKVSERIKKEAEKKSVRCNQDFSAFVNEYQGM